MSAITRRTSQAGPLGPVAFFAGVVLLILAPLIRGGNRHVALVGLECLGLLVLILVLATAPRLAKWEWWLLLSPLLAGVLYLTPLPLGLWSALPGRDLYGAGSDTGWYAASLTPDATAASLLVGIPIVAAYLLGRTVDAARLNKLAAILALIAMLQVVWGLLQAGPYKGLYFDAEFAGGLIGSFANSNHFANFIAMTLPLTVYLLWRALPASSRSGWRRDATAAVVPWALTLLLQLAALFASGSRTGAATAVLVTALSVLLLRSKASDSSKRWSLWMSLGLLVLALAVVGVQGVVQRLGAASLGQDASFRWTLMTSSLRAAWAFFPVGSGPDSYASVYPLFQPPGLRGAAEYAHNDYLQLLLEYGVFALALMGLLVWSVLGQARALWTQFFIPTRGKIPNKGSTLTELQLCSGLGLLAIVLHSWVDFNLRIPANAMLAACLLGIFLRPVTSAASLASR